MKKTDAVRTREINDGVSGWRKVIEALWIPEGPEAEYRDAEWIENETTNSDVSYTRALQSGATWPFPKGST